MGKGIKGLIFGGAVGAALGILLAPREGKKTREMLAKRTEALWGEEAQKKGTFFGEVAKTTRSAVEAGQDIFSSAQQNNFGQITKNVTNKGQQFLKETGAFVGEFTQQNVRPAFVEKNEELRKKIEIAREKIQSQAELAEKSVKDKKPLQPIKTNSAAKKKVSKTTSKTASKKKATTSKAAKPAKKASSAKKSTTKQATKKAPKKKTTKTK